MGCGNKTPPNVYDNIKNEVFLKKNIKFFGKKYKYKVFWKKKLNLRDPKT